MKQIVYVLVEFVDVNSYVIIEIYQSSTAAYEEQNLRNAEEDSTNFEVYEWTVQ